MKGANWRRTLSTRFAFFSYGLPRWTTLAVVAAVALSSSACFQDAPAPADEVPSTAPDRSPEGDGVAAPRAAGGDRDEAEARESKPAIGVIVAREGVDVSAELEGRLQSVAVRIGDRVERGEELARIEAHDLDEQLAAGRASLRAAQANLEQAEAESREAANQAERRQQGGDLFSAEERQSAVSAAEVARAAVKSAKARVDEQQAAVERLSARRGRSTIVAPSAGEVALRYLDPGAAVTMGQPIVRLISADSFLARFAVSPRDAVSWSLGDPVEVAIESLDATFSGQVSQIAPRVDPASQMIFMEAEMTLPEESMTRLQDGLVATVRAADDDPTPETAGE